MGFQIASLLLVASAIAAQTSSSRPAFEAFEVASIKPTPSDWREGRFAVMQEQLGLRRQATNGPVHILVIDRVERPSEN